MLVPVRSEWPFKTAVTALRFDLEAGARMSEIIHTSYTSVPAAGLGAERQGSPLLNMHQK